MEFFILDDNFLAVDVLDVFTSAVWTERFVDPGDLQLVVPATHDRLKLLAPGTMISLENSDEVMLLETRSTEGGMTTVTGRTLEVFFDERPIAPIRLTGSPGTILGDVVTWMQNYNPAELRIPTLRNGNLSDELPSVVEEITQRGSAYSAMSGIAKRYNIGMTVRRMIKVDGTAELVFTTRIGVDRTMGQNDNDLIRFSPDFDTLANPRELLSIEGMKTQVTALPPGNIPWAYEVGQVTVISSFEDQADANPFRKRVLEINTDDITDAEVNDADHAVRLAKLEYAMRKRAKAALLAHRKKKLVDGEVIPTMQYKYGVDYHLGDIVEIQGEFGDPVKGAVTEFIRTQDDTGSRSYPTVVDAFTPVDVPTAPIEAN